MRRGWASTPWGFARRVMLGAYEDDVLFLASALTFDALVALIPLILLLLAVLASIRTNVGGASALHILFDRLAPQHSLLPTDPLANAEALMTSVVRSRARTLSVYAIPFFLWFGIRFFGAVRDALNNVFDLEERRPWYVSRALDLALVIITLVWLVAIIALAGPALRASWGGRFLASSAAFVLGVGLFFVVYTFAPCQRIRWDTALVASVVSALAFEAAKKFYAVYVASFATLDQLISDANVIALALLVVWVYYTACVFLLGGEVAMTYELRRRRREQQAVLT